MNAIMKFPVKRNINIFLYILCLISFSNVFTSGPANAKITIGSSCKKLNEKIVISGDSLICTKLNGVLSWQIDTFNKLLITWKQIKLEQYKNENIDPNLDVFYSPTVNLNLAKRLHEGLFNAALYWNDVVFSQASTNVIFISELDRKWFAEKLTEIGARKDCVENKLKQFDEEVRWNGKKANAAGFNGCGEVFWFEFYIGTSLKSPELKVAPHEYTHLAQFKLLGPKALDYTPCWFHEGGADFFGMVLGAKNASHLRSFRKNQVWEKYKLNFAGMAYEVRGGWENFLESNGPRVENTNFDRDCGINGSYPVGAAATQYLFELDGSKGIRKLIEEITITKDYRLAIKNTYGISWSKVKKEISTYIRLMVAQTPNN